MAYTVNATYPQQGILTAQMMSLYDLTKPEYYPQLVRRYGTQYENFLTFFQNLGRLDPTPNDEWFAWEENWMHKSLKLKAKISAGAKRNEITDITEDVLTGATNTYARVGDLIVLPNGWQYRINKKTLSSGVATYALKANEDVATALAADVAVGTELMIYSGGFAYGGDQPEPAVTGHIRRTFKAQLIKEEFMLEGQEFTRSKWVKAMTGKNGYDYYYTEGIGQAEYRLGLKWDGAIVMGDPGDDSMITDSSDTYTPSKAVPLTKGLIPTITDQGKTILTGGTFAMTQLDAAALHMKRNGATSNIALAVVGNVFNQSIENVLSGSGGFLENTAVDYTRVENNVFKGNRELSVSMNIKYITKGGMTWMIHPHDNFSNPTTYGLPAYDYESCGILFPWSSTKDSKTGMKTATMGMKYLAKNGYSRKIEIWPTSGAGGGTYVHKIDRAEYNLRSHMMFYMLAANQGIYLSPESA